MTTQIKVLPGGIAPPAGLAAAAVATGGTFAAGAAFWVITFVGPAGESSASNEVTATLVANGSANLTWPAPPARVSRIRVYRGTAAGAENTLAADLPARGPGGPATGFTDTGAAGTAGSAPAAGAFASLKLDALGRPDPTDTVIAALNPDDTVVACSAAAEFHNAAGAGEAGVRAKAEAAALGITFQEV